MKQCLLSGLLLLLVSCKSKVAVTKPVIQNITESVYASGIIKSDHQYQVFSAANGIIKNIPVTEGSLVQKGDVLFTLVNDAPKLNTENARIAAAYAATSSNLDKLKELQINIDLAKTKMQSDSGLLQRQRNLWAQGIGSRNELEQRELVWKNSATAYKAALLNYNQLKKQINFSAQQTNKSLEISQVLTNDYIVKAQQNGKVYSLLKEPGEMVNTQTPLAVVGDAHDFLMELQVDEYDIAKIKLEQKIFVTMDSYKNQVFEAVVSKIDPIMNERSRSFTIEALFTAQPPSLYPNLTVEANILISAKKNALTIPRDYLLGDDFVMLQNGEKRKVTTGIKDYQQVEIIAGISKDDVLKKPM